MLLGENVFYPYSPPVTRSLQRTLDAETAAAAKQGFPLKVALIGSPVDLGVIPDLFGHPQNYAAFLDQEISFRTRQPLLVVMAAGYGVEGMGARAHSIAASLPKPAGRASSDLARSAVVAVAALSRSAGHPLNGVQGIPGSGSGTSSTTIVLVILVVGAVAVAAVLGVITLRRRHASA